MRNHSTWFPEGSRLYLEVSVTETGTGEKRQAVAIDTFFANPYYKIDFSGSKKYFKPGFPYSVKVGTCAYILLPTFECFLVCMQSFCQTA